MCQKRPDISFVLKFLIMLYLYGNSISIYLYKTMIEIYGGRLFRRNLFIKRRMEVTATRSKQFCGWKPMYLRNRVQDIAGQK